MADNTVARRARMVESCAAPTGHHSAASLPFPSLPLRMTGPTDLVFAAFQGHASITTGVPSSTISNNSITSSLRILTQP